MKIAQFVTNKNMFENVKDITPCMCALFLAKIAEINVRSAEGPTIFLHEIRYASVTFGCRA